jgi:hypothetical protein
MTLEMSARRTPEIRQGAKSNHRRSFSIMFRDESKLKEIRSVAAGQLASITDQNHVQAKNF